MANGFYCPHCGKKLEAAEIICKGCNHYIYFDEIVTGKDDDPKEEINLQDMTITKFIPSRNEKIVTCHRCNGENYRGNFNCEHCGFLLRLPTGKEEIIEEDEQIVSRLHPSKLELYRMEGLQLYVLKLIGKFYYNCKTKIQYNDGSIAECGQLLSFWMRECPQCNQKKTITYNCTNFDNPQVRCKQQIDLSMLRCPTCGESTMLNDMKMIVTGNAVNDAALQLVKKYLEVDFNKFMLINENYSILIPHQKLMKAKWWLQSIGDRVATMMKLLAMFLDIVTSKGGSLSMPTILSSFNPGKLISTVQSPQPSEGLADLLKERIDRLQSGGGGNRRPTQAVAATAVGSNNEDEDNDAFSI